MADPTSILGNLAQRREEIAEAQKLTLQVPRWTDPETFVTYNLLTAEATKKVWDKLRKVKKPTAEQVLNANADILINACDSVYAVIEGSQYSFGPDPDGEPTRSMRQWPTP